MSAPSLPVAVGERQLTLVAGTALDPLGRFNAMHVDELAGNMDRVTELEGQFVIVQATADGLEIVNDPLGVYPVFVAQQGDEFLISNSATALAVLTGRSEFDPLGISTFLDMRWPMADRTLIQGVTVLQGGQRWDFSATKGFRQQSYYCYQQLAQTKRHFDEAILAQLVGAMSGQLRQLSLQARSLHIPITAGRDTRVMVALSLKHQLAAEFFSVGDSRREDVQTGMAIAQQYQLAHRHDEIDLEFISDNWQQLAEQVICRNDGLVTLAHIHNVVDTVSYDYLPIMLYGVGGEIARGHGHDVRTSFRQPNAAQITRYLQDFHRGTKPILLTAVSRQLSRRYLREFVDNALEDGFLVGDIPEVFKILEKTRRWGGHQSRQVRHQFNVFSPFATRPYVEAVFELSPPERVMEVLPLGIIRAAAPELLEFSFDKPLLPNTVDGLRKQMVKEHRIGMLKAIARKIQITKVLRFFMGQNTPTEFDRLAERSYWFEGSREAIRAFCLDQTSSQLWTYVSRADFERLMHKDNAVLRRDNQGRLFDVVTAFYYEQHLQSLLQR